ncbi:MAG: carboxypeptidase regulatory-like domain-containing protein, partial [Pedobacter sp.]
MMLKSLLVAIFCCCSCATFAQKTYGVKGTLFDTFSNTKVHNATVTVLSAKDSVVQKTVHSVNGRFEVGNLKSGEFLLVVTGPNYADFVSSFLLTEASPVHDFGNIKMIAKSKLLEEVVIKSKVASMKLKGDTTEFNAAAYKTQKHAKADDLLK